MLNHHLRGYADWIRRRQVLSFYLFVYAISWPAMILAFQVFPQNAGMQAFFGLLATFSPALVALVISTIAKPGPGLVREPKRWIAFLIAWIFTWLILMSFMWFVRDMSLGPQVIIPAGIVAVLPGWLLTCSFSRIPGVRELFGTLLHPRGHWLWYLAAFTIVPVVQVAGAGITRLAGGQISSNLADMSMAGGSVLISLTFLQGFLTSGGINEETGWRGFVLPRLQARFPVIVAATIVWFFWALWHLPYDLGSGASLESILVNRLLFNFIWAVLMTWLYNRTDGSLLAPVLFHPSMNAFGEALPRTDAATAIFVMLTVTVIVVDRMWKRLPADSRAVYHATGLADR